MAALSPCQDAPWVLRVMRRMPEGVREVSAFFSYHPFSTEPARFLRAVMYDDRFTDGRTGQEQGVWWKPEFRGVWIRPIVGTNVPATRGSN
ncbi:MAG: lipase maturation factor family protein [Planctomycetota bacterium]